MNIKINHLEKLLREHDFTYEMSDDSRHYYDGVKQYNEIIKVATELGLDQDEFKKMWNNIVDKKFSDDNFRRLLYI